MLQTDGSPKANPASDWAANKDSTFSDDLELLSLLDKLSVQSESQNATATGDTDSVSSQTGSGSVWISFSYSALDLAFFPVMLPLLSFNLSSRGQLHFFNSIFRFIDFKLQRRFDFQDADKQVR